MRIAIVVHKLHGGGAEFVVRQWLAPLQHAGHELTVYSYAPDAGNYVDRADVRTRNLRPLARRLRLIALTPWLRRELRRDKPDIVVAVLTFSNLVTLAALMPWRRRPRIIISERNVPSMLLPREGRSGRLQRSLARWLYRRADAAIVLSHPVAADLIGGYGCNPDRTFVVPNPVLSRAQIDASVARPPKTPGNDVLLFVGRVAPQKRPHAFLDLILEMRDRGFDVSGRMIGDGPLAAEIAQRCVDESIPCELLGWLEPWTEHAGDPAVLVLPSSVEGFGNVLVEAAAAGIPSVAASTSLGVADAIVPGLTGQLALTTALPDFADAVEAAMQLGSARPTTEWLRRFSIDESARVLQRVLDIADRDVELE